MIALLAVLGVDLIVRPKWDRGYGRWVRDVLVWTKGPLLFRTGIVASDGLDEQRYARPMRSGGSATTHRDPTQLSDGGHVSQAAVARFHHVIAKFANYAGYANNNRPVQPLNGRVIDLRRGAKCHH